MVVAMNGRVSNRSISAIAAFALAVWTMPASAGDEIPPDQEFTIPALSMRLPKEDLVSFAALANEDTVAGRAGFMIYPLPLPAALLGVAAHGVIESQKQARERKSKNSLTDLVLAPYQPSLSHFTNAELMRRTLVGLTTHGDKPLLPYAERSHTGCVITLPRQY